MTRIRAWWPEAAVLAGALALRLFLVAHATWVPVSDSRDYHALARSLAAGEGYVQRYEGETAAYQGLTFRAYRMPGYPVFLAAVYGLTGWRPLHAQLANVACDLVTGLLVLVIARRLFGRQVARWALGLFALHVLWTPVLLTEALFTALYTALVAALVTGAMARSAATALGVGALLAAAVLVRPIALAVVPLALARLARRGQIGVALLVLAPTVLALGAWAARNHARLGEVVVFTTNLGAHTARDFDLDREALVRAAVAEGLDEAAINRRLLGEVGRAIHEAPGRAILVYLRRAGELYSPRRPRDELRSVDMTPDRGLADRVYGLLGLQYWLTYPLALAGGLLLWRDRRGAGGLGALLGVFTVLHALVSRGNLRFAAPLYPLLAILGGYALARLAAATGVSPSAARGPARRGCS
jgi:hypothetical protein